jgi:hypothetical protein
LSEVNVEFSQLQSALTAGFDQSKDMEVHPVQANFETLRRRLAADAEPLMKLTPVQHMKMAALMHGKSEKATKPENRKKLAVLADAHRKIAQTGAKKANPAQSVPAVTDDRR